MFCFIFIIFFSDKMTEKLMQQMGDSKWKERGEALDTVQNILKAAKFVEGNLGDLPDELKKRFKDSNKLLVSFLMYKLTLYKNLLKVIRIVNKFKFP